MKPENTNDEMSVVNHMDIKLHGISNVPPNWWADGRAPTYPEHPFRYEVTFSLNGSEAYTFSNGRMLQYQPQFKSYVTNAALQPFPSLAGNALHELHDIPESPLVSAATVKESVGQGAQHTEEEAQTETRIIWVTPLAAEVQACSAEDLSGRRRKRAMSSTVAEEVAPIVFPEEDDPPPCMIRLPLSERHVLTLETMAISGKPLELSFRRVLKPGVPSEWEDKQEWYYRAIIPVELAPLTEPGSRELSKEIQLVPVKSNVRVEEVKKTSKKSKNNAQGLRQEDIDAEGEHPYETHKTSAIISIKMEKSLVRLPSDRICSRLPPTSLIPKRPPPQEEYQNCTQKFSNMVSVIAENMLRTFAVAEETGVEFTEEVITEMLQSSGELEAYKEQLVPLVVNIVREHFLSDKDASPDAIGRLTNELYVHLLDCVHNTLHDLADETGGSAHKNRSRVPTAGSTGKVEEKPNGSEKCVWLEQAEEAEALRDYAHATRCHQARIASCSSPGSLADVLSDAAAYFVRIGETTRAEQCFREAISHDPVHTPSLLGYGALLLSYNCFTEAEVFLRAAASAKPTSLSWGFLSLLCDMHIVNLEKGPSYDAKRARFEHEGAIALKEALSLSDNAECNSVEREVADYLLKLQHPSLANIFLSKCPRGGQTELLYVRLFMLGEQYTKALEILNQGEGLEHYAEDVAILRGDCYAALGRGEDAITEYRSVLCSDKKPQRRFGPSYIHLGNLLIVAGRYNDALHAFAIGIQAWPCSLMWLGAGIAYYRLNKIDEAEECLCESNTLNNTNPRTWAYLSLVCLRKNRAELKAVLRYAVVRGTADSALLTELGRDLMRANMRDLGETCLRKALAQEEESGTPDSAISCVAMYHLAGAVEDKDVEQARTLYQAVVSKTSDEVLRARAEEQLLSIGEN